MRFLVPFSLVWACTLAASCGGAPTRQNLSYADNAEAAFQAAMSDFDDEDCFNAESAFREVRREFPYSRYAAISELRIADCQLEGARFREAISTYRKFVRNRPAHNQVPYARFKIADAHYREIPSEWLLSPPAYERDQGPTRDALRQLRRYIVDYPDDENVEAANEMVRSALTLLARHELYVAEFYLEREQYDAAIARLETLLNSYPGSGVEAEALLLMGRVFLDMENNRRARAVFQQLIDEFPDADETTEARAYLVQLPSSSLPVEQESGGSDEES